jgi:predicted enzyme related to lactoylglutathione lyase
MVGRVADTEEERMRVMSVIADIPVADIGSAKSFYADYLGLSVEEFNMGWVARYTSPDTGANVQLLTSDATARENPVVTIKVDDVEAALEEAERRGYEVVHPLTTESWGVRRFFVRAPDGNIVNVAQHRD